MVHISFMQIESEEKYVVIGGSGVPNALIQVINNAFNQQVVAQSITNSGGRTF